MLFQQKSSSPIFPQEAGQRVPRLQRLPNHKWMSPTSWLTGLAVIVACVMLSLSTSMFERELTAQTEKQTDKTPVASYILARDTGRFELRVNGPDGKPVPKAVIEIRGEPHVTATQIVDGTFSREFDYGSVVMTDDQGKLTIQLPQMHKRFELNITTPGFAPYWATWTTLDPMPAKFTADLEAGWSVGGIVVDQDGNPVSGASIRPSVKFMKRPGETSELHLGTRIKTDLEGHWRFDSVPASKANVFVEIDHQSFKPLRKSFTRSEFGLTANQQPSTKVELDRGLTVMGNVTDESGKPIVGALVRTKFLNDIRETRSEADGTYRLGGCEPAVARVVVSAKGMATDMQEFKIDDQIEAVDFVLKPGGNVRVRVLDLAGNPIPKARIFYQAWRGGRFQYFEFDHQSQYADDKGIWEWNEAPLDEFHADICSNEMTLSRQPLIARDEIYEFKIPPALVVTGRVFDADTKQPIQNFKVVPGIRSSETHMNWVRQEMFTVTDGTYRMRQSHDYCAWLVRIEAEGYLPAISRDIKSNEGSVTLDFELTKAMDIIAKVAGPKGQPAKNAQVALGTTGSQIDFVNGRLDGTQFARYDTDDAGQLKIPPQENKYRLFIVHPEGYGHVIVTPESPSKSITLTAWSKVSGTFSVGKETVSNVPITINTSAFYSSDSDLGRLNLTYDVTTGKDGSFAFDRVISGPARIGRRIMLSVENGAQNVTSSGMMPLNPEAGEKTEIHLGGRGRPVIGQLQVPDGFGDKVNWSFAMVKVGLYEAHLPMPKGPEIPADIQEDAAKRAAWKVAWLQTKEGKAWVEWRLAAEAMDTMRETRPYFTASVDRDGTFRIDDVPEGNYSLSASFFNGTRLVLTSHTFEVPPFDDTAKSPVELGALPLTAR